VRLVGCGFACAGWDVVQLVGCCAALHPLGGAGPETISFPHPCWWCLQLRVVNA